MVSVFFFGRKTGKRAHYDIFVRRIIAPMLHGADEKSLADLGARYGLTEKQTGNRNGR